MSLFRHSRSELNWNGTEFEPETLADRDQLPFGNPFPDAAKPEPVEAILKQLGWRNWIND